MLENLIITYPFLGVEFLGNSTLVWLKAMIVFFLVLTGLKLFQMLIINRLKEFFKKTKTELDDIVINAIDAIYWPFYALAALFIAIQFISVREGIERWAFNIFMVVVIYYAIKFLAELIDFGAKTIIKKRDSEQDVGIIKLVGIVAKIILWVGAIVLILANLGYNVTSLIAGLGIGGIAIALALQNILADLFSSLAIYFDKPFKVGDFIVIGEQMGTVKKVGLKTTRVQVPQGEELVIANSELAKTQLRNFGVMEKRRGLFNVGVTYNTPAEKLKRIPDMMRKIIEAQGNVEVDRIHFRTFGDSSLVYEIVYYFKSGDYAAFLDVQQAINLAIVEKFEEEGIKIAYPTQTVYVKK